MSTPSSWYETVDFAGCYPPEAYICIKDALNVTVEKIHGPMSNEQQTVYSYMAREGIDLGEVIDRFEKGQVNRSVARAIEKVGDYKNLSRHISGRELCWGVRDFAWQQWGLLADVVLDRWNIRETADIGKIVFNMIEHDLMQKQPTDRMEDFVNVYEFEETLIRRFDINTPDTP